ncbi:type IIL restriction-modification enzyme MmeI [Sphingomonas faeni]|uniref:type IIL restriction-modification enzyme MmeI n=1 Tax=Sphingomonas faeni TaxID=185950 RepID=UPI003361DE83
MNVVEIEEAVSRLAAEPFDANEFPWEFLAAFGNNETTIKRLRSGHVTGGVLRRNDANLAVAPDGEVTALRDSATVPRWRRKIRCRA